MIRILKLKLLSSIRDKLKILGGHQKVVRVFFAHFAAILKQKEEKEEKKEKEK